MDPKLMNTINKNGRAYNGNRVAVFVAFGFISTFILGWIISIIN